MKKISIKALFYGVLLTFVAGTKVSSTPDEKPMVIISCGYNNKNYYIKNLESTLNQNYKNYRIIYVDDASPDGTADLVRTYLINHNQTDKVTLIHNNHRQGSLANLTHAIFSCKDNEIMVRVDADDWLADEKVLSRINEAYNNADTWLTYGNYKGTIWPHAEGGSFQIPSHVIENNEFRNHLVTKFDASHLVTYYAWLFKKIKLEDLLFKGEFWPCAPDLMTVVPMLEMAGKHSTYIPEILYIWNNDNPLNEFKGDCHATSKHKGDIYLRIVQSLQERPGYEPLNKAPILEHKKTIDNEKPMVIVSCGYNHKNYFKQNLESTLNQNYKNYRIIYVDDASPDSTGQLVEDYLETHDTEHKVTLIRNRTRLGLMANLYQAIHKCQDHEIVVMVEADDWLADGNVLSFINDVYQDKNVWLTYGSFIDTNGNVSGTPRKTWEVPQEVINQNKFREHGFITGHLRTFYASLFKQIKLEDFLYEDKFFPVISDVVKMFPMLEMAGNHIKFIQDILYIWNTHNPINENKTIVHKDLSKPCHEDLLKRKKYKPLDALPHESSMQTKRILLGSPIRRKPLILKEFLENLEDLQQVNYVLDYFFIDDNDLEESRILLEAFGKKHSQNCIIKKAPIKADDIPYVCDQKTHHWKNAIVWKVAAFKDDIIEYARTNGYDYLLITDSDHIMHPDAINHLINAQKDIITSIIWFEGFGNEYYPQVYSPHMHALYNLNTPDHQKAFYEQLLNPGIYPVKCVGGCTLISKDALNAGVSFKKLTDTKHWGEDIAFSLRAEELGFKLFVDTTFPIFHIFRDTDIPWAQEFKKSGYNNEKHVLKIRHDAYGNWPSKINKHFSVLHDISYECSSIIKIGNNSHIDWAILSGLSSNEQNHKTYTIINQTKPSALMSNLAEKNNVNITWLPHNPAKITSEAIPPADMLLINNFKTFQQTENLLDLYAAKIAKYIVLHDIHIEENNQVPSSLIQFLETHHEWMFVEYNPENNGLILLQRILE